MTRTVFAALAALSLALGGAGPARALENEDLAKMLLGVAAAALVGHAIDQRQGDGQGDARARAAAAARDAERAAEDARIVEVARRAREARSTADFAALARRQAAQAAGAPQTQAEGRSLARWVSSDPTWTGPIWPGVSELGPIAGQEGATAFPSARPEAVPVAGGAGPVPRPAREFRADHPVFGQEGRGPRGNGRPQGRPFRGESTGALPVAPLPRPAPPPARPPVVALAPVPPVSAPAPAPAEPARVFGGSAAPLDALATVPAQCLDRHETGNGPVRILGQACLAERYRFYALLPSHCLREVVTAYGSRYGHDPSCLRAEGFSVADLAY